jgi:hypothetical protein
MRDDLVGCSELRHPLCKWPKYTAFDGPVCQTQHVKERSRRHRPTKQLVRPEAMRKGLQQLLADTERYTIVIRRSGTNPETGETQDKSVRLFESDQIDLTNGLDQRLLRSKRVIIVLAERDRGVARIDLTARSWEILQGSTLLADRLAAFNSELVAGARSRLTTASSAGAILFAPLWSFALLFIIWSMSSSKNENAFWGTNNTYNTRTKTYKFPPLPEWLHGYWHAVLILWPVLVVIVLAILSIRALAGGLQVWPESITFKSASRALTKTRLSTFTVANASNLIIAVVAAVIGGVIVLLVSHL